MLVDLPVIYCGDFYSVGSQAWRHRIFTSTEPFSIIEMDDSFEIAATGLDIGSSEKLDVVWHDDKFWIRETVKDSDGGIGPLPSGKFHPMDREQMTCLLGGHAWQAFISSNKTIHLRTASAHCREWLKGRRITPNPRTYNAVEGSTLDDERERMQLFLNNVRALDGHIYRRVEIPCFFVDKSGKVNITLGWQRGGLGCFRLDRADDLRSYLEMLFGHSDGMCDVPELMRPDVFIWDDEVASVVETMQLALSMNIGASGFGERGQAKQALYKAYLPYSMENTSDHLEAAVDAMEMFGEMCLTTRVRSETLKEEVRAAGHRISCAVARWRMRPIELADMQEEDFRDFELSRNP